MMMMGVPHFAMVVKGRRLMAGSGLLGTWRRCWRSLQLCCAQQMPRQLLRRFKVLFELKVLRVVHQQCA